LEPEVLDRRVAMTADYHDRMSSITPSTTDLSPPSPVAFSLQTGAARLDEWGLIEAQGADAASFLQGQLTQDVQGLAVGRWRLAGYCSPKGRLLASFWILRVEPERYWLLCSADLLAPTLKRLKMFVLRAKCQLTDRSADVQVWGYTEPRGANLTAALTGLMGSGHSARATTEGWALVLPTVAGVARELWLNLNGELNRDDVSARPDHGSASIAPDLWRWLEVASGVPRISAATVEQFVPQMINFEAVGGVNFQKGCYPGQEVVARSQYRGTLKRRASLWRGTQPLKAGDDVRAGDAPAEAEPVGRVVLAAPSPDGHWIALIESTLEAAEAPSGLRDSHGGALTRWALPYTIPAQD
jgi:tRNA-modifying protein YgfZ